jgi:Zn-dependent M28 family amino/carboxypeptidase
VRLAGLVLTGIQLFGIVMCLHADFTPYSPGANDNASGVAVALTIAARLRRAPLANTEVHLAFTGCEEVGDYGIAAYLDRYAAEFGPDAVYAILDEVGLGQIKYLSSDGLLLRHRTHPRALELAREVKRRLPEVPIIEGIGTAYTDALQATKRGLIALTVCTIPDPKSNVESHWHRMTDRVETLNHHDLSNTIEFTWTLLRTVDGG